MAIGKEVRLKYAYYVTCREIVRGDNGEIAELICEYDLKVVVEVLPMSEKLKELYSG